MDDETRLAIRNSASYLCETCNKSALAILYGTLLTPEEVVYRLLMADAVPDGACQEIIQTFRGFNQRTENLYLAIHGNPGEVWKRRWCNPKKPA